MSENQNTEYSALIKQIGTVLNNGRQAAVVAVNDAIVQTNWEIGKYIVEYEQKGNEKAEYGSDTLNKLSKDLTSYYGKGFSRSNISRMRQLFLAYPKRATLSHKLSWSHYVELLKIDNPQERSFYLHESENENWGVRELKRQMNSMLFQRLALCKDKNEVIRLAQEGQVIEKPEDIGQMNLYLNYYREEMNTEGDTEPIGIVMGAYEDKLMVKYATQNISNQLFVSRYQLYLPDSEQLESEIHRIIESKKNDLQN